VAVLPTDEPEADPVPADPVPCAIAAAPDSANTAANPIVVSFMVFPSGHTPLERR
jgi:hypothetical protein